MFSNYNNYTNYHKLKIKIKAFFKTHWDCFAISFFSSFLFVYVFKL